MNKKIKKIISYYKPYKKMFFFNLLASSTAALVATVVPIICNRVMDLSFVDQNETVKSIYCAIFSIVFLILIRYLCNQYSFYKGNMFAAKIEVDIKNELFEHFQKQDFTFFDERTTGKLLTSITNDAYNISNIIKKAPEVMLDIVIKYGGTFVFIFCNSVALGFSLLLAFALLFIFIFKSLNEIQKINASSREVFSDLVSDLEENLSGIRIVKSFTNENLAISNFRKNNERYLETRDKMYKRESAFFSAFVSFIVALNPLITTIGVLLVLNGILDMGKIILFLLYIGILEWPLWDIIHMSEFLRDGIVGFDRIMKMLEINPKIFDDEKSVEMQKINGNIKFENVCFRYNSSESKIFENLNLEINQDEYVALVGASGSGKSTLCNLIPRFYDVSGGEILIDDINIKNIKIKNLRKNIGFVHQESILFSGTIYENISYGNIKASNEEIIEAAKNACAHDFIMKLPLGYDTKIGHNGIRLSGGQKQRISIARVFLKNPPILIFDEATSSLDNESEKIIQKSMEKLSQGRTTIVIAHRLSTIRNAKRILVLDDGKIIEEGSHDELMSLNGAYKKLYNSL